MDKHVVRITGAAEVQCWTIVDVSNGLDASQAFFEERIVLYSLEDFFDDLSPIIQREVVQWWVSILKALKYSIIRQLRKFTFKPGI